MVFSLTKWVQVKPSRPSPSWRTYSLTEEYEASSDRCANFLYCELGKRVQEVLSILQDSHILRRGEDAQVTP